MLAVPILTGNAVDVLGGAEFCVIEDWNVVVIDCFPMCWRWFLVDGIDLDLSGAFKDQQSERK